MHHRKRTRYIQKETQKGRHLILNEMSRAQTDYSVLLFIHIVCKYKNYVIGVPASFELEPSSPYNILHNTHCGFHLVQETVLMGLNWHHLCYHQNLYSHFHCYLHSCIIKIIFSFNTLRNSHLFYSFKKQVIPHSNLTLLVTQQNIQLSNQGGTIYK